MIGFFGDIVFETSDKRILNFSNFSRNISSRWAKHDVIGRKPTSEFNGPDLDTISFTVNLNGSNGVKPIDEMNKWLEICRKGEVKTLVIGNRAIGTNKWTVQNVSQIWKTIFNDGKVYSGNVDVSLTEYVGVL
ncbi:phage tail protein [Bacillaceae bacterium IKA-2]|nr:phage tail protein [Bacillaceae bacterium IKA-2]